MKQKLIKFYTQIFINFIFIFCGNHNAYTLNLLLKLRFHFLHFFNKMHNKIQIENILFQIFNKIKHFSSILQLNLL